MSLSAREQRVLESIKHGLAESDPGLVSLLGIFSRLVSGEAMPAHGRIQAGNQGSAYVASPRPGGRLRMSRAMVLLWLLISIGMIAVALAIGSHGASQCAQSPAWSSIRAWSTASCPQSSP